jgi:hypothetical protein
VASCHDDHDPFGWNRPRSRSIVICRKVRAWPKLKNCLGKRLPYIRWVVSASLEPSPPASTIAHNRRSFILGFLFGAFEREGAVPDRTGRGAHSARDALETSGEPRPAGRRGLPGGCSGAFPAAPELSAQLNGFVGALEWQSSRSSPVLAHSLAAFIPAKRKSRPRTRGRNSPASSASPRQPRLEGHRCDRSELRSRAHAHGVSGRARGSAGVTHFPDS